jgi:hypothetical protein
VAANGEIIKSFLVGLGFDVDDSSLAVFNNSIKSAALRVTALYGTINAFAGSMVYAFAKISEGFEEMGYQYHIIAPAINKAIVLRNELLKAYSAAGINIRKVIVDSVNLNMSLAKTKFAMEAIYKSVGSKFFGLLQRQSDAFRKRLYENMPYIINALEHLVKGVFKAFEAVTQLGMRLWSILGRVFDFFVALDKATDGWSTVILGVVAAWKLLNLAFIATPLGAIITGLVALLALYDDFKTYKEGGQSFFNWGPVVPIIDALSAAFTNLYNAAKDFVHLFSFGFGAAIGPQLDTLKKVVMDIAAAFGNIATAIDLVVRKLGGDTIGKLIDLRDSADHWVSDKVGQVGSFVGGATNSLLGTHLGANQAAAANTNINANMQTSINITGSPNADATARLTGQQQQNVNRDFVRNMKGATR